MLTLEQRYEAIELVLQTMPVAEAVVSATLDSRANYRGHTIAASKTNKRHVILGLVLASETKARVWLGRSELLVVRLTRIAPRSLDDDNAATALKSVRDGFARAIGVDDRDPRVRYVPDQVVRSDRLGHSVSAQLFSRRKR